jgi:putative flippase GtrA
MRIGKPWTQRLQRLPSLEFLRYVVVQGIVVVLEYAAYVVLLETKLLPPVAAHLAARAASGLTSYLAHARVTFRSATPHRHAAPRYLLLLVLNAVFSAGVLSALLKLAGPILGKVLADTCAVGFNFFVSRRYVFGRRPDRPC